MPFGLFRTGGIRPFVKNFLHSLGDLSGKIFIDLPAGSGHMTREIRATGATVEAYDLYPEFFKLDDMECKFADLEATLPIPDGHADYVLCQEGVEHLPALLAALRELNRVLKPGGKLVLTTPNGSNLRGRLAGFLIDGYLLNKLPINELDAVRSHDEQHDRFYFGHIFLVSAQKLRILARIAGFKLIDIRASQLSMGSLLLGVLYPIFALANLRAYRKTMKRHRRVDVERRRQICKDVVRMNLHPKIMFGKKLFLVFEKEFELKDASQGICVKSWDSNPA